MNSSVRTSILRSLAAAAMAAGIGMASPLAPSLHATSVVAQRGSDQRAPEQWRFEDHDRQTANDWYRTHANNLPIGIRERDRFPTDIERRFEIGFVLDRNLRGQIHTVPRELSLKLRPAPRGDRYVFIGGHLVLINSRYEVVDVIHFGHDR